jgi:anti-anti-sigma factor
MEYKLSDLIDVPRMQELMDSFYAVTQAPSAILDSDGTVLTATAWQDICTQYHRTHPDCELRCRQSDTYIAQHLNEGANYVLYECANGLVDVASPIIVEGEHVGTVFTGQFLLHEPDVEFFRAQAREFDFDEVGYLQALKAVPVVQRDRIEPILTYLGLFTSLVADIGLQRLLQIQAQHQLQGAEDELRMFKLLADNALDGIGIAGPDSRIWYANSALRTNSGFGEQIIGMFVMDLYPPEGKAFIEQETIPAILKQGAWQGVLEMRRSDDSRWLGQHSAFAMRDNHGQIIGMVNILRDVTAQHQAEEERSALQNQVIDAQRDALRELSTPLIPVSDKVVIMPLIGTIDSQRAQLVMETLLEGVANTQAELAILDITGVTMVDTQVAQALISAAQAVKLLGAQVMLTGIQPQIAQTLVHLGVDLSNIMTRGSLQSGIAYALSLNGLHHRHS